MSQIGLNISVSGLTGKLIIRWRKTIQGNPNPPETGRSDAFDFPYDNVYTIVNLKPVVYLVELWRSDDGVALDQLIKDWSIDASKETRAFVTTYQYVIGRGWNNTTPVVTDGVWSDPNGGDDTLTDTRLDGFTKDQLLVHEAGYGNHTDAEYDLNPGGGIILLGGKQFDDGVAWFITVFSTEVVDIPGSSGTDIFAGVEIMEDDHDFDEDHYNKLVIANGSGTVLTETIPDLSLIPDGTHVTFQTHQGSQNYLVLQFDPGDTVNYLGKDDVNVIYVPKCQKISLYFFGGVCYVVTEPSNALNRGQVVPEWITTKDADTGAFIYADESTGELSEDDYPGLYAYAASLTGTSVCPLGTSVGQWGYSNAGVYENKQKWGIDTVAHTFRVPHLSGLAPKFSSTPGIYEADQVGEFTYNGYKLQKSGTTNHVVVLANIDDIGSQTPPPPPVTFNSTKENRIKTYSQKPFIYL